MGLLCTKERLHHDGLFSVHGIGTHLFIEVQIVYGTQTYLFICSF